MKQWIQDYAKARYGQADMHMLAAWDILYNTVYGSKRGVTLVGESPICARPHLKIREPPPTQASLPEMLIHLSGCGKHPGKCFRRIPGSGKKPITVTISQTSCGNVWLTYLF
ncbi:MAG: alpha-N-acetylglucosaminidase C-terminal domain-containing protein [Odoribacter sp.]